MARKARGVDFERPLTTVDLVIFSIREASLWVLLVKRPSGGGEPFPGRWALPGGFIDVGRDKDLAACAARKLREKTGVTSPYLEQVGSWGSAARDPRGWSATHVYFSLLAPGSDNAALQSDAAWHVVTKEGGVEPRLAFDHARLLDAAVTRLRAKVEYTSLPVHLVPSPFTLGELQKAYEIVMGRTVNKAAFRTRILASGLVESTGKYRDGPTRPAELFRTADKSSALTFFPRTFSPRS